MNFEFTLSDTNLIFGRYFHIWEGSGALIEAHIQTTSLHKLEIPLFFDFYCHHYNWFSCLYRYNSFVIFLLFYNHNNFFLQYLLCRSFFNYKIIDCALLFKKSHNYFLVNFFLILILFLIYFFNYCYYKPWFYIFSKSKTLASISVFVITIKICYPYKNIFYFSHLVFVICSI